MPFINHFQWFIGVEESYFACRSQNHLLQGPCCGYYMNLKNGSIQDTFTFAKNQIILTLQIILNNRSAILLTNRLSTLHPFFSICIRGLLIGWIAFSFMIKLSSLPPWMNKSLLRSLKFRKNTFLTQNLEYSRSHFIKYCTWFVYFTIKTYQWSATTIKIW